MKVDPETLRATEVDRLTTGPGPDARVAVSSDGRRLAYTAKSQRIRSWLFPFDATTGQIRGKGDAITSPGRMSLDPVLSADGAKVVYVVPHGETSGFSGDVRNELWLKSLVDGREAPVISDDYSRWLALWSPDGMQLAYESRKLRTSEKQLMVWSGQSRDEEPLTTVSKTGRGISDWSRDGKWLVVTQTTPQASEIWLLPLASAPHAERKAQKIVSDSTHQLFQPHSSPNGRWIVFDAVANSSNPESTLYTVPMSGGRWTQNYRQQALGR